MYMFQSALVSIKIAPVIVINLKGWRRLIVYRPNIKYKSLSANQIVAYYRRTARAVACIVFCSMLNRFTALECGVVHTWCQVTARAQLHWENVCDGGGDRIYNN